MLNPSTEPIPREAPPEKAADLVLYGGTVLSMDGLGRRHSALAVRAGRVAAVGSDAEVLRLAGDRTVAYSIQGQTAIPGFIETHNHPMFFGWTLKAPVNASTPPNETIADILDRVRDQASQIPKGQWIRGERYDDTLLRDKRHPTRWDLDRVSPDHPVYITHVSGHLGVANSYALGLAGITRATPDPSGGRILRDESGEPTGVLAELAAQAPIRRLMPSMSADDMVDSLRLANDVYISHGITSVHDTGMGFVGGPAEIQAYASAIGRGAFLPRVYAFAAENVVPELGALGLEPRRAAPTGVDPDRFRVGAVKMVADGSIQGLTGALSEPYFCAPHTHGVLCYSQEAMDSSVQRLHAAGWHVGIHGNGDGGIQAIIDSYQRAGVGESVEAHRYRIEHCQAVRDDQLEAMARLGIYASFFVKHVYYWGDRHRDIFLGPERGSRISPLNTARRLGIRFALHSDCPVTPVPPLEGIWCAVERITRDGRLLGEDERIPASDALRAYTADAAHLSFEEAAKGTLEPGKHADIAVLDANPLDVPSSAIRDVQVEATLLGGEVVFQRPPGSAAA